MDGRIGHLHCRFKIYGVRAEAVPARLERVGRERLAAAWEAALQQGLGDDPAVYVLRRVETAITLRDDGTLTDGALAERWGGRLAGEAVRRIATDAGGPDLVRFEDQSDFLARFIADVLRGTAWDRWFYGAFAGLRHHSRAEVLHQALVRHREHLPATLRRLRAMGDLDALLRALDPEARRDLWSAAGADQTLDLAAARAIFAQALDLIERLDLWARERPGDAALEDYLASGPLPADWRDAGTLANALRDLLRSLDAAGYLRHPPEPDHPAFLARLDAALAGLDWMDTQGLRRAVLDLLVPTLGQGASVDLPVRPHGGLTPRQRDLLADLLAVLRAGGVGLDPTDPDDPANGLRLQTALTAHVPRWDGDPAATAMIRHLLRAWVGINQARSPREALHLLRAGELDAAERLATAGPRSTPGAFGAVYGLGEPALAVVERLLQDYPAHSGPSPAARGFETASAGLFFLLRAILDLRLPWLIRECRYPNQDPATALSAVLRELGLRLSGTTHPEDAGLRLFAGIESPIVMADHRTHWAGTGPTADARYQAALFATLVRQRIVDGAVLHLYRIDLATGRRALIGGEADAALWPFGCLWDETVPVETTVTAWCDTVERTTGNRPLVIAGEEIGLDPGRVGPAAAGVTVVPDRALASSAPDLDAVARHDAGAQALDDALGALGPGMTGDDGADLTLDLTAIALVRVWARWLRHFSGSTTPYLLHSFVRRPGWIGVDPETILVEPESGPLDVVLELAGYLDDLEQVPWLGGRRVRIRS